MGFRINIEWDEKGDIEGLLDKVFDRVGQRDKMLAEMNADLDVKRLDNIVKSFEKLPEILKKASEAMRLLSGEGEGDGSIPASQQRRSVVPFPFPGGGRLEPAVPEGRVMVAPQPGVPADRVLPSGAPIGRLVGKAGKALHASLEWHDCLVVDFGEDGVHAIPCDFLLLDVPLGAASEAASEVASEAQTMSAVDLVEGVFGAVGAFGLKETKSEGSGEPDGSSVGS